MARDFSPPFAPRLSSGLSEEFVTMTEPVAPPTATARLKRRLHRVSTALWYFRGEIDDYRYSTGWNPLSPLREQRLIGLLRWARQLTSRSPRSARLWPDGQPVSAALALRLIRSTLRDLYRTEAGKPRPPLGHPRRDYPNPSERLHTQRADRATPEEDAAMWAEFEREEAQGTEEE
jgi:hypothetical protein